MPMNMEYIKVSWIHDLEDDPILLYSELDDKRFEVRKIEIYHNDSFGIAGNGIEFGGTALSYDAVPTIEEIAADSEFIPKKIPKNEFEEVWNECLNYLSTRR